MLWAALHVCLQLSYSSLIISFVNLQFVHRRFQKVLRRIIRDYWNCSNNKLHSEHNNAIVPVPDIIPDDDIAIPNTVADFIGDYDSDDNYWNNFSGAISDLPWRGIGGIITAIILAIAYIISS